MQKHLALIATAALLSGAWAQTPATSPSQTPGKQSTLVPLIWPPQFAVGQNWQVTIRTSTGALLLKNTSQGKTSGTLTYSDGQTDQVTLSYQQSTDTVWLDFPDREYQPHRMLCILAPNGLTQNRLSGDLYGFQDQQDQKGVIFGNCTILMLTSQNAKAPSPSPSAAQVTAASQTRAKINSQPTSISWPFQPKARENWWVSIAAFGLGEIYLTGQNAKGTFGEADVALMSNSMTFEANFFYDPKANSTRLDLRLVQPPEVKEVVQLTCIFKREGINGSTIRGTSTLQVDGKVMENSLSPCTVSRR